MGKPVDPLVIGEHIRRLRVKRHVRSGLRRPDRLLPEFHLPAGERPGHAVAGIAAEDRRGPRRDPWRVLRGGGDRRRDPDRPPPDRRRLDSTWTDAHLEALGSTARSRRLEPVLAVFGGGGGKSGKRPHSHSREEFAFVVKGRVTRASPDQEYGLGPGDAVTFPAWLSTAGEPDRGDRRDPDRSPRARVEDWGGRRILSAWASLCRLAGVTASGG